jgi:hypothetical protein
MTAVEWLYKQLNGLNKPILDDYFQTIFSQAKEIEKQQIIDAYSEGDINGIMDNRKMAEQYYNETFKNK